MTKPIEDLRERKAKRMLGGGEEAVRAQHDKGKKTARERLALLFDAGSFVELELYYADGVVGGYGTVDGRAVYAYAQDYTAADGAVGARQADKIVRIQQMARQAGVPIVAVLDSGGVKLTEGVQALNGYGRMFYENTLSSGVIPQIAVVLGPCAGGAVFGPAISDFLLMEKKSAKMFVTGPQVIQAVAGLDALPEDLGNAESHAAKSGAAHIICEGEEAVFAAVKELLGYLPSNNLDFPPAAEVADSVNRLAPELETILPENERLSYDIYEVIRSIADGGAFLELQGAYATNIVTAFIRLAGSSVGVVASRVADKAGVLDIVAAEKAARFVRRCDAFNIPLLTLADVSGFLPDLAEEEGGIVRHGAKLLYAYCEATVPKVTLVLRKACGGAYAVLGAKASGTDIVLAWPSAQIGPMDAPAAAAVLYADRLAEAADPIAARAEMEALYKEEYASAYVAAAEGLVDDVIEPAQTRQRLVSAFDLLESKRDSLPAKKHGNIPL
ncbi:MAG: methylmalonyl-CoA carboxyltransferase [Clostridiales Family XIII bacterium]|jgi:acetyl-CoA carboxylase carboxyltransferase component|nr:methylmalonyl-CoA carboxyltransferase [Clostridiales Family XIII bacterium]